jgi:glyoxylase-like metal-dependent hydrolase (beta-lactamase superfamily II)
MKSLLKISLLSALIIAPFNVSSKEKPALSFASTEVAPGLHMLMGVGGFTGGNIGLSLGEDGVIMIDDSMPPMLDMMKAAIAKVTDKPVNFLINTHVHGDHTGNNEAMGNSGTHIVAHENLRRHLINKGVRSEGKMIPAPKAALPVITFSDEMNFHLNGNNAHIFHVANAHTDGDAVIHFKDLNVMHTGDTFFNGMFPYIDLTSGGSVDGYIAAQQKILSKANAQTKIIPGHGALADKSSLQSSVDMLVDSKKLISHLLAKGKTEAQIIKINPLAKYHDTWNWGFITTEKMTRQMVKGLSSSSLVSAVKSHNHSSSNHSHSTKTHSHQ